MSDAINDEQFLAPDARGIDPTTGLGEDRCPGVLRLHPAYDGGLARVRLPGGMLGPRGLRALAEAAALGSGIIELTSRAGIQVRGVADSSAGELERILTAGGLLPSASHDRVRNVLASPLGGRHPAALGQTDPIVIELDRLICRSPQLSRLAGRFVFEVDDASGIGRAATADVTLRAVAVAARALSATRRSPGPGAGSGAADQRFRLVLAGIATDLTGPPGVAAGLGVAAAEAFLELREKRAEEVWHLRELENGPAEVAGRLGGRLEATDRASAGRGPAGVGVSEQRDGRQAVCGLARLGRLDARQFEGLAELSRGPTGIRISPWRTVTVVDVPADDSARTLAGLAELGLIVAGSSPWVGLSACAGLGACTRARIDVRDLAASRAAGGRSGETEHWSACERRCGEPVGVKVSVAPLGERVAVRVGGTERLVETPTAALAMLAGAGR